MTRPRLTVLLPVRNGAATLPAALASLAAQTFDDLRVVVLDDGSSDDSAQVARSYAERLPGLEVRSLPPRGIARTLADALERVDTPLVARMDADDVAHPRRLEAQVRLLDAEPDVVLCGTHVRIVARDGEPGAGMQRYARWIDGIRTPDDVRRERFVECPIVHPTFCFRRDPVVAHGGYRAGEFAEDHDLVLRLAEAGLAMANVDAPLLDWTDGPTRLSRSHPAYSWHAFLRLKARYLARHVGARPVIVWGTGRVGRFLSRELLGHGVAIEAFLDIAEVKWGRRVRDRPVHAPEWVAGPRRELIVGAVGTLGARALIRETLTARGLREPLDFVMAA